MSVMGILRQLPLPFDDAIHLSGHFNSLGPARSSELSRFPSIWHYCVVKVSGFLENLDAVCVKAQSLLEKSLNLGWIAIVRQL